jgi:hypothetical protein
VLDSILTPDWFGWASLSVVEGAGAVSVTTGGVLTRTRVLGSMGSVFSIQKLLDFSDFQDFWRKNGYWGVNSAHFCKFQRHFSFGNVAFPVRKCSISRSEMSHFRFGNVRNVLLKCRNVGPEGGIVCTWSWCSSKIASSSQTRFIKIFKPKMPFLDIFRFVSVCKLV